MNQGTEFADDILFGAAEISRFLFGTPSKRRRVYQLAATSQIPVFKLGPTVCARKSRLIDHFEAQEALADS